MVQMTCLRNSDITFFSEDEVAVAERLVTLKGAAPEFKKPCSVALTGAELQFSVLLAIHEDVPQKQWKRP